MSKVILLFVWLHGPGIVDHKVEVRQTVDAFIPEDFGNSGMGYPTCIRYAKRLVRDVYPDVVPKGTESPTRIIFACQNLA